MKNGCAAFQNELEQALAGGGTRLARLDAHAHVAACAPCRAQLARERKLDALLAGLAPPAIPSGLSTRVRAAVAAERAHPQMSAAGRASEAETRPDLGDGELDELLERLPAPGVPVDLARRVLEAVAPVRRRRPPRRVLWVAAAAALLAALGLWAWRRPGAGTQVTDDALEGDEELLEYTVERWDLLNDEDLDLWLASLDPLDQLLMEYADDSVLDDVDAGQGPRKQ